MSSVVGPRVSPSSSSQSFFLICSIWLNPCEVVRQFFLFLFLFIFSVRLCHKKGLYNSHSQFSNLTDWAALQACWFDLLVKLLVILNAFVIYYYYFFPYSSLLVFNSPQLLFFVFQLKLLLWLRATIYHLSLWNIDPRTVITAPAPELPVTPSSFMYWQKSIPWIQYKPAECVNVNIEYASMFITFLHFMNTFIQSATIRHRANNSHIVYKVY